MGLESIEDYINKISEAKININKNLYEIGKYLKEIKENKLYKNNKIDNFNKFINTPEIDIGIRLAKALIKLVNSKEAENLLSIDVNKLIYILELEEAKQKELFKNYDIKNLPTKKVKEIVYNLKNINKVRCERCKKLVSKVKEIDGKFYGYGGKHSCYEKELEEQRLLSEGKIPPALLDNVLNSISKIEKKDKNTLKKEKETITKLIEILNLRLYKIEQIL